jgi:hypothetical protein
MSSTETGTDAIRDQARSRNADSCCGPDDDGSCCPPGSASISVTFSRQVTDGMHGAIAEAVRPA